MKLEDLTKHCKFGKHCKLDIELHYKGCMPAPIGPQCPVCMSTETKFITIEWEPEIGEFPNEGYACIWCHTIFADGVVLAKVEQEFY